MQATCDPGDAPQQLSDMFRVRSDGGITGSALPAQWSEGGDVVHRTGFGVEASIQDHTDMRMADVGFGFLRTELNGCLDAGGFGFRDLGALGFGFSGNCSMPGMCWL